MPQQSWLQEAHSPGRMTGSRPTPPPGHLQSVTMDTQRKEWHITAGRGRKEVDKLVRRRDTGARRAEDPM